MVNSHAGMLVPGWNEWIFASARSIVSCTRSSARSTLPDSEIANARRLGIAARIWSLELGSSFIRSLPFVSRSGVELPQEVGEAVRHAFLNDIVVDGPQLLSDFGLNFPVKPECVFLAVWIRLHGRRLDLVFVFSFRPRGRARLAAPVPDYPCRNAALSNGS